MPRVILTDSHSLGETDYSIEKKFFKENGIEFIVENCKTDDELIEKCKDADGILTIYTKIHKGIIQKLCNCRVIVRYGIGYDNIDVDAATKKGIYVCNIPNYCVKEVATHTIALILAIERKIAMFDRAVRKGIWDDSYGYPVHRLDGQVLGLVGFGSIARQTADYAKSFGFNIIACDPYLPEFVFKEMNVKKVELETLLRESDIISLHVPLNDDTRHLINSQTISKIKKTAIIVNTSRGPIIALDDLIDALKNNRILAAGLDVLETEPLLGTDAEILKLENVIITPHAAFNTVESIEELHRKVAETASKIIKGELPENVVNKRLLT
jgi:D-3-phosphoglycerate dehydrogenase